MEELPLRGGWCGPIPFKKDTKLYPLWKIGLKNEAELLNQPSWFQQKSSSQKRSKCHQ